MNFLEFAVWGAYLTSLGTYLASHGLGNDIGSFYVIQGIVSIFMPGLMGIVADRWVPSQRLLGICHFLAGGFMIAAASYGFSAGDHVEFSTLFTYYALSVAFYMPTLALSNAVAFNGLTKATHQQNYIGMRSLQEYRSFLELTFMLIYNSSMIINE